MPSTGNGRRKNSKWDKRNKVSGPMFTIEIVNGKMITTIHK